MPSLEELGTKLRAALDEKNLLREEALALSREIIRTSANTIRAVHRGEFDAARQLLGQARAAAGRLKEASGAHIDAYTDGATIARQLGVLPPQGSPAEAGMTRAFNVKTRVETRLSGKLEDVAEGVWLLRGGFPGKTMNVYFVRDGNGVLG